MANVKKWRWTPQKEKVAELLAAGYTIRETSEIAQVPSRNIDRWKTKLEFAEEVDRLSLMLDISSRAGRVRMAKRMVMERQKAVDDHNKRVDEWIPEKGKRRPKYMQTSTKDPLEWLKFIQSETNGARLFDAEQLATIIAALNESQAKPMETQGLEGSRKNHEAENREA